MSVEMTVAGLGIDPLSSTPVLVLADSQQDQELLVAIGLVEASAIAMELEQVRTPRPLTHDLLCSVIRSLGAHLLAVEVTECKNDVYHACLILSQGDREVRVDARTSDAIAVALRMKCPILVSENVLAANALGKGPSPQADSLPPDDTTRWSELLSHLPKKDPGEYIM